MNLKRRQRNLVGIVAVGLLVAAATLMVVQSKGGSSAPASSASFSFAEDTPFDIPRSMGSTSSSPSYSARSSATQHLVPSVPDIDTSDAPPVKLQVPEFERSPQGALLTREDLLSLTGTGISDNALAWSSDSVTRSASSAAGGYGGYYGGGGGRSFPGGGGSSGMFPGGGGGAVGSPAQSSPAFGGSAQTASLAGGRQSSNPADAPLLVFPGNPPPHAALGFTATGAFGGQSSNTPAGLFNSGQQNISTLQTPVAVPEPTSLLLLGGSVAAVLYRRRRRSVTGES